MKLMRTLIVEMVITKNIDFNIKREKIMNSVLLEKKSIRVKAKI